MKLYCIYCIHCILYTHCKVSDSQRKSAYMISFDPQPHANRYYYPYANLTRKWTLRSQVVWPGHKASIRDFVSTCQHPKHVFLNATSQRTGIHALQKKNPRVWKKKRNLNFYLSSTITCCVALDKPPNLSGSYLLQQ